MESRAAPLLPEGYHLALSISQKLWVDLLSEALPIQVGEGDFDLIEGGRKLLHAAEDQVKGLLTGVEDRMDEGRVLGNPVFRTVGGGVRALARGGRRRASRRIRDLVKIQGRWRARVSRDGSRFSYHEDGVTLDARAVVELEGRAILLGDQFEIPFTMSRNVDGTASLNRVGFHRGRKQLEGRLEAVSLSLGDSAPMRIVKLVGDRLLERQVGRLNPVPLVPADKFERMIMPSDGPLRLAAGIEDVQIGINQTDLTLAVRFAFKGSGVAA